MHHKHGLTRTPEYRAWASMKQRCTNPRVRSWSNYGGRGITVCERWSNSFEFFLEDMGPRPTPAHSLDRIDNDGHYEPGNCRWATASEQRRNDRNNRPITFAGETLPLIQWAQRTGITARTIGDRLDRGWPVERALTQRADKGLRVA